MTAPAKNPVNVSNCPAAEEVFTFNNRIKMAIHNALINPAMNTIFLLSGFANFR